MSSWGYICRAPFRSAYVYYITLALATRRSEASSQLRHNRLRPLSLNSAGLSDRGVDSGSDQTGDVTFASRDSCKFHKALDGASHVSHSLFLAFAFGMVGVSVALPGLEPTTKSPGSEVRRANHCAAGAPHFLYIKYLIRFLLKKAFLCLSLYMH